MAGNEEIVADAFRMAVSRGSFRLNIRIRNAWVAGGFIFGVGTCSLAAFYLRYKEKVETAAIAALQGPPAPDGQPDPAVVGIEQGSILVKLLCHTRQSLQKFIQDFVTHKVHQHLKEEFSKIGFEGTLEITIEQLMEVGRSTSDEFPDKEPGQSGAKTTIQASKFAVAGAGAVDAMSTMYPHVDTFLAIIQSFAKLDPMIQEVLVQLAVFKGPFTTQRAKHALNIDDDQQVVAHLRYLVHQSLLVHCTEFPESRYSILPAIRDICLMVCIQDPLFRKKFNEAKQRFTEHYRQYLEKLFQVFYSKNSLNAIKEYQEEEENIKQLLYWCAEDPYMDDALRKDCVDTFNRVGELLAKLIRRDEFEMLFTNIAKQCEGDDKRKAECWVSVGIKIIFSCARYPKLCDTAEKRAKAYFLKAKPVLKNTSIEDNSLAQCYAKLGRCNAAEGKFEEGQENINMALAIRKEMHDKVMLGATYNDLAVAQTLNQQHEEAIKTEKQTLKIYDENLGQQHPFTATIYNNMGNNNLELHKFKEAIPLFKKALAIREKVLPDHPDMAKSLIDLAMAYKGNGDFDEAREYMEKVAFIQEKVSRDTREKILPTVHRELADIFEKLNRLQEAEEEMEKVRKWQEDVGIDACCTFKDEEI